MTWKKTLNSMLSSFGDYIPQISERSEALFEKIEVRGIKGEERVLSVDKSVAPFFYPHYGKKLSNRTYSNPILNVFARNLFSTA